MVINQFTTEAFKRSSQVNIKTCGSNGPRDYTLKVTNGIFAPKLDF